MKQRSPPTGYARLSSRAARIALLLLLVATAVFVGVALRGDNASSWRRGEEGDAALYRAEINRIRAGEDYYKAAAAELPSRGYPTRSIFNWRTPLPMWMIGKLPAPFWGKVLLIGLALGVIVLAFGIMAQDEKHVFRSPLGCALLLTGTLMALYGGDSYTMPVLWAGAFIALSICCYGVNRPWLGVVFGLAAVFFRELALPYCLLAAGIAWWNRRWKELAAWFAGTGAWFVFFGWHCLRATEMMPHGATAHSQGWLQLGGAGFVILTAQMNLFLLELPQWITALYLTAALFGLAGWDTPLGQRTGLTVCLFITAFAFVGHNFNQYWGCLYAPLLCFGVARFPASLRDAFVAGGFFRRRIRQKC